MGRPGAASRPCRAALGDGYHTYSGLNDKIPLAQAGAARSSLRFLHVAGVMLSVFAPGEAFGNPKRRVQGRFRHAGTDYRLWVTDPVYEQSLPGCAGWRPPDRRELPDGEPRRTV